MSRNLSDYGDILTVNDVKEILGIGSNTAYKLLISGTIKNFKIGSVRKIPKWCLEDFIRTSVATIHITKGD